MSRDGPSTVGSLSAGKPTPKLLLDQGIMALT